MADRITAPTAGLLAAPVLAGLVEHLLLFPPLIRERGRRYAENGHVSALTYRHQSVEATVRGTELYATAWDWDDDGWVPECSCPVGPYCKHAYALACCFLMESRAQSGFTDPRLAKLLPGQAVLPATLVARQRMRASAGSPIATTRASERKERGAVLQLPVRNPALEKLRSARQVWQRQAALDRLLAEPPGTGLNPYHPVLAEILGEEDPDLLCWRLAQEIPRLANGWLPRPLIPYRDHPGLAAKGAARARAALARELVKWAQQRRETTPRSLRLVFSLERPRHGQPIVTLQVRLTTPRLIDEPRSLTQLRQLRNDLRSNPRRFSSEQAAVLEWLDTALNAADSYTAAAATTHQLNGTMLRSLLARLAAPQGSPPSAIPLASWAEAVDPDLARRAGVIPGAAVRVGTDAARLLPTCVSRGGELWIDLAFFWPHGRQCRLDAAVYLRGVDMWSRLHPSFVLADGEFSLVLEEPPQLLLDRFHESGGLPAPPAERAPLIAMLAAHFPHLRETVAPHTRLYAVTPAIALDLRNDDWLQLRLFAHTGGDAWRPGAAVSSDVVVFEYTPFDGWTRYHASPATAADDAPAAYESIRDVAAAPCSEVASAALDGANADRSSGPPTASAAAADMWFEAPDPAAVAPATTWLALTAATPGMKSAPGGRAPTWPDRAIGWWMIASPRRMAVFAEQWAERPADIAFFGTERVRRLLSGQQRVTPRLHIASSGADWFAVEAEWEAEGLQLSDADLAKLRSATGRFVKLPSGWVSRDLVRLHDETMEALADLGVDPGAGEQRLTLWQLAGAKPESLAALERMGADPAAARALTALRARVAEFTGLPSVAPPAGLTAALRPYQQQGLDFLAYTAALGMGAILADDMGLGKTVQALAWLEHVRAREPRGGPALVVCPASVVHNWAREAAHFTPNLRVLLLTSGSERHELRRQIPHHDLIVTNYALLRRDLAAWREIELRALVLDEAQQIKNPDAAVTKAVGEVRARHRLALTGTPLENRALDLWSIANAVNPGYLGTRAQFSSRFDRLDAPAHARALLAAKLRPVLLRRLKREVAPELPERIEERLDCELTTGQRQLYLAELRRSRKLVEQLSDAPGGIAKNKITILAALTRLRQICCHPALAQGRAGLGSGKFDALFELLEPLLAEGHKVLLFSQFVECLKLLSAAMRLRNIPQHLLTGQSVKRERIVDAFQNDPEPGVFLISLKAGGTGLNLTSASYVVLFDPWWNPAVEAQAIDRTHRIGQDRTVIAYRLLALGTIEEKIWELQQRKAALARDVLGEDGFARALTRSDLDYLLADA